MSFAAAAGMGLASLAGGIIANQASAKQANRQMDFQATMSNTAHQRQVADLKAAGLNPILSANAGAGVPTGAMSEQKDVVTPSITSAIEGKRLQLDIRKQAAEVNNLEATNKLLQSQKAKTDVESHVLKKGIPGADTKNMLFDSVRPYLKKAIDAFGSNAKSIEQKNREAISEWERLTGKKSNLNPHKGR